MSRSWRARFGAICPVSPPAEKRAFSFQPGPSRRQALVLVLGWLALCVGPLVREVRAGAAQQPAELVGQVAEAGTGAPIAAVRVLLLEAGRVATTDAGGRFRFRGLEPGEHTLSTERLGFAPQVRLVRLENGRATGVHLELDPQPVPLDGVSALAELEVSGGHRIHREAVLRSGAHTAGELLGTVPGLIVRSQSNGGPQTVSLRGSDARAVLVLVDGIVVNDPITGEADLSTIRASVIETITILPGAQSARYGPGAEAGVVLIETRRAADSRTAVAGVGSHGLRRTDVEWSSGSAVRWTAGAAWLASDGRFDFKLPPEAGGGDRTRANADSDSRDVWLTADAGSMGGRFSVRAAFDRLDRGLPGKGYAPARHARQSLERSRTSVAWRRETTKQAVFLSVAGTNQVVRAADSEPPLGPDFDETTRIQAVEFRSEIVRNGGRRLAVDYGYGMDGRWQRVRADNLVPGSSQQHYVGVFGHTNLTVPFGHRYARIAAHMRTDTGEGERRAIVSRSFTASIGDHRWVLHAANRTSYSPPALGDQYFREAVGVRANPDLRGERVPGEIEIGVRARHGFGGTFVEVSATSFRSDIRDMIIWAPDFRFVWSPRNFDVKRRGTEAGFHLESLERRLRLSASHTLTRVTYNRGGGDDTVQVVYRPRNTANLGAGWHASSWFVNVHADYLGRRYPVPAPINALPGFWTLSARAGRTWTVRSWEMEAVIRADRIRNERSTLIFGFPHPGRTVHFVVRLRSGTIPFSGNRSDP